MKLKKYMAVFVVIIIMISGLIGGMIFMNNKKETEFYKSQPLSLPQGFTYTAHTGCCGTEDNSLEAIKVGIEHGADIVEFDLNFLSDGTPVLAHDKPKGNEITLDEAFKKAIAPFRTEKDFSLINSGSMPFGERKSSGAQVFPY